MKKIAIIIISALILILIGVGYYLGSKPSNEKVYDCIQKGKECTKKEIQEGIKVKIKVGDKKTETFYVLSNTKEEMTLLMANDYVKNINWNGDFYSNSMGPYDSLQYLMSETESWNKIKVINSYEYEDYGYKQYNNLCKDGMNESYKCNTEEEKIIRGYEKYVIKNGEGTLYYNPDIEFENKSYIIGSFKLKTRIPSKEEIESIEDLEKSTWLINNLKENECYWTLSSSIALNTNYNNGAYAVCNIDQKPSLESILTRGSEYKTHLRPVIVVEK